MSIELFQRIAFRLTRIAVVVAFVLGILISFFQVFLDFDEQRSILDQTAYEIYSVSKDSAYRIAFQLDDYYAEELVDGLKNYQVLQAACLLDDRGNIMADFKAELKTGWLAGFTEYLVGATKTYRFPVRVGEEEPVGQLKLVIDNYKALDPFYGRAFYVFAAGLLRNLALASVLVVIFHFVVTKPLIHLAVNLSRVNAEKPNRERLAMVPNHHRSEIGYIIQTVNTFIENAENAQLNLRSLEHQLRLIINTVPMMIYAVDEDSKLLFVNTATADYYQRPFAKLVGRSLREEHRRISVSEADFLLNEIESARKSQKSAHLPDVLLNGVDGQQQYFEITVLPFTYFEQSATLLVLNDVTERVESQRAIQKLAYHDMLTGLPNRTLFQDRIKMDIRRAERFGRFGALLFIDLDKFKLINDTLGHAMGDELLVDVSKKLSGRVRGMDTLARMGGDEFAISLNELGDEPEEAIRKAVHIANEINELLNQEIALAGQGYQISASIGVVCFPQASSDSDELLRFADAAMYQAKNAGRHQVSAFRQDMIDRVTKQVLLEKELLQAFVEDQFEIVLQPIFRQSDMAPASAEVLMRWRHPERGLLTPYEFMDYLESMNLMHKISDIAIRQVAAVAEQLGLDKLLKRQFRFSINISTLEFYERDFVSRIRQTIQETGAPYRLFELEITESIALHDLQSAQHKIRELERLGIGVSLDDFGTGYSSLSYLKNLNIGKLKIDKSFIDGIESDIQDQKLVESIIAIATNFDMEVVVEGVESQEQLDWLNHHHGLWYQGYHFSRPLLKSAFLELVN